MGSGAWGCGTHPHVPTACSTQVPNINPADTGKKLRALPVVLTLTHRASTKPWTAARLNETPPPHNDKKSVLSALVSTRDAPQLVAAMGGGSVVSLDRPDAVMASHPGHAVVVADHADR